MSTANELTRLVDDVAGCWTERALEVLAAAGSRPVSVDMEVEIWRSLKTALRSAVNHGVVRAI